MKLQEIVGAIVAEFRITTDVQDIDASMALGMHVEYISRADALQRALAGIDDLWTSLASSPTLFLFEGGFRFVAS